MAESRKYVFQYRLPGDKEAIGGWSDRIMEYPEAEGFLLSPFLPHSPRLFIPKDFEFEKGIVLQALKENVEGNIFSFPVRSTSVAEHQEEVEAIIDAEKAGCLDKAVAARAIISPYSFSPEDLFRNLCDKYPSAFIFLFSTPESGTWVGASPELLLSANKERIETMALAGTRPIGTNGPWDSKNLAEQSIVADYISGVFRELDMHPKSEGPVTKSAGPVEHLMTNIHVGMDDAGHPDSKVLRILDALSPTPALCGMPRETASEIISRHESFDRAFYGGYCGPWRSGNSFSLYVNIRCVWLEPTRCCLMAGGGIMPDSNPKAEWLETERKAETLSDLIKNN